MRSKIFIFVLFFLTIFSCKKEEIINYTLTVNIIPPDAATANPASGIYEANESVTINLAINSNYIFDGWSGDVSGEDNPLTITLDSDKNLNANFLKSPVYLDQNGITIKAYDWAQVGDIGEINGEEYTIVSLNQLKEMIDNNQDITKVCTSKIINMEAIFASKENFNQDISSWDTSNVTDMNNMFSGAKSFNTDISYWDTSNVTDMSGMFAGAISFNKPIGNWNTSSVTDMSVMFADSLLENLVFNQPIGNWDTSNVTTMLGMFMGASIVTDVPLEYLPSSSK